MRGLARVSLVSAALAVLALAEGAAAADQVSDGVVKIGVLTDMTGFTRISPAPAPSSP
jgi:hypothetical protein